MPTIRQKKVFKAVVNGSNTISQAMLQAGYSPSAAARTNKVTRTKGWQALMQEHLPDKLLAERHKQLLNASRVDHVVFPLGLSDNEIIDLMADANCTVKKFMHSETQTHVWFWSADNKARATALDMAYKLKGRYEEKPAGSGVNILIVPAEMIKKYEPNARPIANSKWYSSLPCC